MPKCLTVPSHLPPADLEARYRGARDPVARSHWQIIWLLTSGRSTTEVAAVTGYSVPWVRQISRRYTEGGPPPLATAATPIPARLRCSRLSSRRSCGPRSPVLPPTVASGPAGRSQPGLERGLGDRSLRCGAGSTCTASASRPNGPAPARPAPTRSRRRRSKGGPPSPDRCGKADPPDVHGHRLGYR